MADPLMMAQSRLEAAYMDLNLNNRQLSIDPEIAKLILELALKVLVKCQASNGQATNLVSDRPVLARLIIRRHVADVQGKLWYEVRNNDNSKMYLDPHDVFHVASWMTEDGILGKGVIAAARETIGAAKARQEFGAGHFGNGALPGIIIKHPKKLSPEARQSFRTEWNEIHAGAANAGKLALLQEGAEAQVLSMSPVDSQFVQSSQFDIEEIARWYGVPPHLIQHRSLLA